MSKGTAGCNELQRPTPDEITAWERRPLHPNDDLSTIDAFPEDQAGLRELQAEYLRRPITRCAEGLGLLDDFVARTGGAAFGRGFTTEGVFEQTEVYYRRKMCTTRKWYGECGTDGWPLCVVCLARMVFEREQLTETQIELTGTAALGRGTDARLERRQHEQRLPGDRYTAEQAMALLTSFAAGRK